jgi:acyl-CoA thioester hydrolase
MAADRILLTEITFHVRFAETDQMGIVHHSVYPVYFEEGRSALSRQHNMPYSKLEQMGYSLTLSSLRVRFLAPARYDDLITVRTWIERFLSRGINFGYEVVRAADGELLVTGQTQQICVDRQGQVRRLPEAWIGPLKTKAGIE